MYAYGTQATPFGELVAVISAEGLIAVGLGEPPGDVLERVRKKLPVAVKADEQRTRPYLEKLGAYLRGESRLDDMAIDTCLMSPFQKRVLLELRKVPAGSVVTYGELAHRIGKPGAARAVGGALARNPIPLVLPCHRVIASDGGLGGFSSPDGVATKARLLALEGVEPSQR